MAHLTFHGNRGEDATEFFDSLEMACLISGRDDEAIKLRAFALVVKGEARVWFNALGIEQKDTWEALKQSFLRKYGSGETPESLWQQLIDLR